MWIDTHNHFDVPEFDTLRDADWQRAQENGVIAQFVMGVRLNALSRQARIAELFSDTYFALGLHPLFVNTLEEASAIAQLDTVIRANLDNPKFIGIGEIGLDGQEKGEGWAEQVRFFKAQLKLARDYDLPVFIHSYKAVDDVLKYCHIFGIERGIAHAFIGSTQQAERLTAQGLKLGFGGAFTYARAQNLQRLIKTLPLSAFVLETDAPDMPPAWLTNDNNRVYHLPKIAEMFAEIRGIEVDTLAKQLLQNTCGVVPSLPYCA